MPQSVTTRCCIAGGGPAGVMLGYLLARSGIDAVVLEKHPDFFRDFRGDTIHPSTMQVMHELGLLDDFLRRPHDEVDALSVDIGDQRIQVADFRHLPTRCKFIALMPQWDFLDFLSAQGRRYSAFHLHMGTEATNLLWDGERVIGVAAQGPDGPLTIQADLVVAADGRHSTLRPLANLQPKEFGAPMDVLWLRLSRHQRDPQQSLGRIDAGRMVVLLNRRDYWQCAYVIPKGGIDQIRAAGLEAFRRELVRLVPVFADRVVELTSWDDIKLLTVAVNRLSRWHRPGLLCIGDAAHAMSPIGGVGVNLAVQDAVAAPNILVPKFQAGSVTEADLLAVQRRRARPVRLTQRMQLLLQKRVITNVLRGTTTPRPPLALRLVNRWPFLQRVPARLIGMGFRPEHVRTAAAPSPAHVGADPLRDSARQGV